MSSELQMCKRWGHEDYGDEDDIQNQDDDEDVDGDGDGGNDNWVANVAEVRSSIGSVMTIMWQVRVDKNGPEDPKWLLIAKESPK